MRYEVYEDGVKVESFDIYEEVEKGNYKNIEYLFVAFAYKPVEKEKSSASQRLWGLVSRDKEYKDKEYKDTNELKEDDFIKFSNKQTTYIYDGRYNVPHSIKEWILYVDKNAGRKRAAKTLAEALSKMSFKNIVDTDFSMRNSYYKGVRIDWRSYKLIDFIDKDMSHHEIEVVTIFSSLNRNGNIREHALRLMMTCENSLPFVVLRLNDWAKPVRQQARETFLYRLNKATDKELIDTVLFIEKLKQGKRDNHQELINKFYEVISKPERKGILKLGIIHSDVKIRRVCAGILCTLKNTTESDIIEYLSKEKDPLNRKTVLKKWISQGNDIDSFIDIFATDKSPQNRSYILEHLYFSKNPRTEEIALKMLHDKNLKVIKSASFFVTKLVPDFKPREFYIRHLEENTNPLVAIYGLSVFGVKSDTNLIELYLENKDSIIVKVTLVALIKLDTNKYSYILPDMLTDERVGISRTAMDLIIKHQINEYEKIYSIFETTNSEIIQQRCFKILLKASKWYRLKYILISLNLDIKNLEEIAQENLKDWLKNYNKSYAELKTNEKVIILDLLEKIDKIDEKTRTQLKFYIR